MAPSTLLVLAMPESRADCWHCASNAADRVRYDPRYRCADCADQDFDPIEPYDEDRVKGAFSRYMSRHLNGSHAAEHADLETAVEWARESPRFSDFERYIMVKRLMDRGSLKSVAVHFDVTEGAVSRGATRVCRKIAVWLNSPNKAQLG